jgi:hypothetical protein
MQAASNGLHGIVSQKTELFITSALRVSDHLSVCTVEVEGLYCINLLNLIELIRSANSVHLFGILFYNVLCY